MFHEERRCTLVKILEAFNNFQSFQHSACKFPYSNFKRFPCPTSMFFCLLLPANPSRRSPNFTQRLTTLASHNAPHQTYPTTAQRCRSETEKFILEDLFSSVLSKFKKYHPS